ncbi:MAG: hypothetical protein ACR2H4_05885 [Pyrinomonadaceae bacterium]
MRRTPPKSLERTAYHEAGHVVIAHWLQKRFRYVTIKEDDENQGHMKNVPTGRRPDFNRGGYELRLEKIIMVKLAGPEAESVFAGRRNRAGASDDYRDALDLAACRSPETDDEENYLYLKWLAYRTRKMLKTPYLWFAVEALARELLIKETIKYNEAREIIQKALKDSFKP